MHKQHATRRMGNTQTKLAAKVPTKVFLLVEEHTQVPKKELDKILKHDLWWDAEKCLKYGLIDEII